MSEFLSHWLKEEIDRRGWSQRKLARQADIAAPYLSNVINGNQEPGEKFFQGVAKALGVSAAGLKRLNEDGTPPGQAEDISLEEMTDLMKKLSPEARQELLNYAAYQIWKEHDSTASDDYEDNDAADTAAAPSGGGNG